MDPPPPYTGEPLQGGGYPQNPGFPQNPGYPSQHPGYPSQHPGYPSQYPGDPSQYPGDPSQYPGYPFQQQPQQSFVPLQPIIVIQQQPQPQPEEDDAEISEFDDKGVRHGFVRKLYGVFVCQLVLVGIIIAVFMKVELIQEYVCQNVNFFGWPMLVTLVIMIVCIACTKYRREAPINFIFLGMFTIWEGFFLGAAAVDHGKSILIAVGVIGVLALLITIFSLQTKINFSTCVGILLVVIVVFGVGAIANFGVANVNGSFESTQNETAARGDSGGPDLLRNISTLSCMDNRRLKNHGYDQMAKTRRAIGSSGAAALIFGLIIVFDSQRMIQGKHYSGVSPDEYIFAILNIYVDIILLFTLLIVFCIAIFCCSDDKKKVYVTKIYT